MAKKLFLEKYIKTQLSNTSVSTGDLPPIFHDNDVEDDNTLTLTSTPTFFDMMSENHTLIMHNSILKYQNIKLVKENTILQSKLKQKMLCDTMHWEIIEEIKFCEWLNNKQDLENLPRKCSEKIKKRKSDEGVTVTQIHSHTHTQESKKVKITVSTSTPPSTPLLTPLLTPSQKMKEKDVIIIYDSDETDTDNDDDNKYNKVGIIHFDSDSD